MLDALNIQDYSKVVRPEVIDQLHQLAAPLAGAKVVHVNSTKLGGGVAEILDRLIPLKRSLNINASWETIGGDPDFFVCTKAFHNGLQGNRVDIPQHLLNHFESINEENAEKLRSTLEDADYVFIHDPQPAPLLKLCPNRKGKWVWRCHIDVSRPHRPVWKYLKRFLHDYDASIYSLAAFAQPLGHPQFLVPPSIDPLSEKNIELSKSDVRDTAKKFGFDLNRPIISQISRFDRFKDPVGVIRAYKLVKEYLPVQLVLAGGGATDDPEGAAVLEEVKELAGDDPDLHILLLPPDAHRTINAIQRCSDVVLQKSVREGFGLTVTEALWKKKPVIGGETGGITLQVVNHHTGFLVNTPEGAAFRIRYLLSRPKERKTMGKKGFEFVRDHFLLTRHLRDYLTILVSLNHKDSSKISLG